MKLTPDDFKGELVIDRDGLDEALIRGPELFHTVSDQYILSVARRDEAKDDLNKTSADLNFLVRKNAQEAGTKVTEAMVKAGIDVHPDYINAQNLYREVCKEASQWLVMKESFLQRAYALKDLVELFTAGYFARSSLQGKASKEVQEQAIKDTREKLNSVRKGN